MRLDRNIPENKGRGKYALLLLRNLPSDHDTSYSHIWEAIKTLEDAGIVDWGFAESETEFFLIRLKDRFAGDALRAYADAAQKAAQREQDEAKSKSLYQWAIEVLRLAGRAGDMSPFCKTPD